ncbi:type II toxin-antitoxin system VapC family toxin [Alterisphingorhabdus coralli]|uniref:Ribonuclease VapC n=1 Tax=Alterisphingorhabdus coralli TaxID=3071408 RepID=A0AA97I2Y2_9SPHN|nr:type II toxin-antitoxin system VapC family toxin [Parasphingorhabdus sp. SCSIO 66989]WOE76190.1 type II toxin-antitoxin system VapC family toxin [Parasphingorhabdus sp. SCSIO 66989]
MIAVDTSALIAIQQGEPEAEQFGSILQAEEAVIASPNLLEYYMVITARYGEAGAEQARAMIAHLDATIFPWPEECVALALAAFETYGKGRHRAALNFGDCIAYALAKYLGIALLFKGDDFRHTDIRPAWQG